MGAALGIALSGSQARANTAPFFSISEGLLSTALQDLAAQSGTGILFSPDASRGARVQRLFGSMPMERALKRLLAGTGLTFHRTSAGTYIVLPAKVAQRRDKLIDTTSRAEEIIVNGANRAGAIKQDSDTKIDVITELEIKRLPNLDVSDVLLRLPGVRRNDTQSGENRYVSFFGMNNAAASQTIDGILLTNYIARSRATSTEALTSAFFKTAIVSAAATPDLDENSNSANVALTTISGLDGGGEHLLDLRLLGGWTNRSGGLRDSRQPLRASATWRGTFDHDDRIGFALGVGLDRLGSRQDAVSLSSLRTVDGVQVPDGMVSRGQTYTKTQRLSALARLDFRPSERASMFAEYLFLQHRYVTDQLSASANVSADDAQSVASGSGQFTSAGATYGFSHLASPLIRDHLFQFGADLRLSDADRISFRFGATLNRVRQTGISISGFNAESTLLSQPIGYRVSDSSISLRPGTSDLLVDPSNYLLIGKATINDLESNDHDYFASIGYNRNAEESDRGLGLKFGAQLKTLDIVDTQRGYAQILAPGQSMSLADVAGSAAIVPLQPVAINEQTFLNLLNNRGIPSPDINNVYAADPADGFGQSFKGAEQIVDLYGIATYAVGQARLSAGIRAAHTQRKLSDFEPDASGIWGPVRYRQSYWDFLPAVYGHYQIRSGLMLRAGISRTLERPPINGSGKRYVTSYDTPITRTITYSDPNLKPIRSDNAEASAEYVYGPYKSFVTFALFAKRLHDIPATTSSQSVGSDGVLQIVNHMTNVDVVNGHKVFGQIKGLELTWSAPRIATFPSALGNLGAMLSYSRIVYQSTVLNGSNDTLATNTRLVDAAPRNYFNAALYYSNGPFSLNAFVQKQSSVPTLSYDPSTDRRTYYGALVDLQINFALSQNILFMVEARNLTDQRIVDRYGLTGYGPAYQVRRNGRTLWFGIHVDHF